MKKNLFLKNIEPFNYDMRNDQLLDDLLREELTNTLPANFAEMVSAKAIRRMEFRNRVQQFIIYVSVVLFGLMVAGLTLYVFSAENWDSWVNYFSQYSIYLFQALGISIFILFIDKVLLPVVMMKAK